MNNIYRLVWNRTINQWVVACEFARSTQRGASRTRRAGASARSAAPMLSVLAISLGLAGIVQAAPIGGQITAGSGNISQTASTTTILQSSQNLSLNWQGFNVAPNETVNFVQPGSNAIAVNRIQSSTGSQILGHLNANGQVWLINPNGILFGQNAQVNVGGIVASTLDVSDNAVGGNSVSFGGAGTGSIVNKGTITAASGGYVALIGNTVSNQGVITAALGTVALGGGSAATLTFSGDQLVHLQVDQSTLNNLVENNQLIQADGGQVTMTAGAKDTVLASVVNNTGVIYARTVSEHNGVITLLGGMKAGQVNVGGTLDASAPNGGNGGAIETSAAQVKIADNAVITASARNGQSGTWLIDPTDLTIDTSAATAISNTLSSGTNVTEQTTANSVSGLGTQTTGAGDINVNAAINWTNVNSLTPTTLTLSAYHAINVNAAVHGTGSVVMDASGGNLTVGSTGSVSGDAGVILATGANFINNAGAAAVSASTGKWLVYSTSPTSDTSGGLTPDFIQYNAAYQALPALAAGNAFLYSVAPALTVNHLSGAVSKTYDGTNTATLSSSNVALTGLINGDTLTSMAGTFGSSNTGVNLTVTSSVAPAGLMVKSASGIDIYGYGISGQGAIAAIGTITPAILTASIIGTPTKIYDGTSTATLASSNYALSGFVAGQNASVNQPSSVVYGASNAGAQTVSATFSTPNFVASSGTNLLNYTLPTSASGAGTIEKASVEVTGVLANNKVYNGTVAESLNTTQAGIYGVIPVDSNAVTLNVSGANGQFATANVGSNLAVSVSGFTLSGAAASNYQIVEPPNLVASITPKSLTITGLTATNKVYDATRIDGLNTSGAALFGVVSGDASNVSLSSSSATGTFASANVGAALAVSSTGFGISGTAASNYLLVQPTGLVADITPAALAISLIGNLNKVYDGSTNATLGSGNFSISGFVPGQSATVSQGTAAAYSASNAGTQTVTTTLSSPDISVAAGTLLSNYSLPSLITGSGLITPAPLMVVISNNPVKVYDSTATATLSGSNYALSGFVTGQSATINHANGLYASANAGVESITTSVAPTDYIAGLGTSLSNYILPSSVSGFGTITPLAVFLSVQASIVNNPSKTYDGNSLATLNASNYSLSGFLSGQGASVSQTVGHYSSVNAGAQPISAVLTTANFAPLTGTNLANYTLPTAAYGTGTITPRPLSVTVAPFLQNKTYDGSTNAELSSSNYLFLGLVGSEKIQVNQAASINYLTSSAGAKSLTAMLMPSDFTASGTLLSNYVLPTSAVGNGLIKPAPLFISGALATDKVYNTTTADVLNTANAFLSGLVASDISSVALVKGSAVGTFSTANVGSNLVVTPSGFSLSGSAIGNYTLQPIAELTANITPASLSIQGVSANNKSYDATNAATLSFTNATLSGVLTGTAGLDNVTLSTSGATGTFGSVNVGSQLAVGATGFSIAGAQAGNYVVSQLTGLAADITPAVITPAIIGNPTKSYDGSTSTTLTAANYTLSGFVASQGATVPQSATANYTSPDAGTNVGVVSTLVLSDFVANAGTQLSNYALPSIAGGVGTITPAQLTAMIVGNPTKTYDSTTSALLNNSNYVLSGFVGSQGASVNQTAGTYGSANAGLESVSASLAANNFSSVGVTNFNNYILPVSATGNGTITRAPLTVRVSTTSRVYDGTTIDILTGATLVGNTYGPNIPTLSNATTGQLGSSGNVGTDTVTTAMTLTGINSGNYSLAQPTNLTAWISPAILSATSTATKVYDGTTSADIGGANTTLTGFVSGQGASVNTITGNFSQANVGNPLAITSGALTSGNLTANAGTLLSNYTLPTSDNGIGSITAKVINLTGTRNYDGVADANANIFMTNGMISGINGERLSLSGSGTLASKTVGSHNMTSLDSLALVNGTGLASNYTLVGGTDNATITPLAITVAAQGHDKIYNANSIDPVTLSSAGVFTGDTVNFANASANFGDKNVGQQKAVTVTGITASGSDASNYTFNTTAAAVANITPLSINVNATGVDKVYDANVIGTVTLASAGVLTGDAVTFANTAANFLNKNVGQAKPVNVSGITASGGDAGNYSINTSAAATANITPLSIIVSAVGNNKVYDASTIGTVTLSSTGLLGSDTVAFVDTAANFTDKNVGQGKSVNVTGISKSGLDANNYSINTVATTTANITPLAITVSAVGTNKIYDANTIDSVTLSSAGVIGTDAVNFANTAANFTDKNVGQSKTVNVTGISATGRDVNNYVFDTATTTLANITPLSITVSATGTDKVYNGNTIDAVALTSTGVLGTDKVTFAASANFIDKNVGQQKIVNVTGIADNGIDAGNYVFNSAAATTASITPAVVNLSGVRFFDGSTTANAAIFGSSGTVSGLTGETLALTGSGTLASPSVGTQPVINLGNLKLGDNTGLAANYTLIGGIDSANILQVSRPMMLMAFIQSFLNTENTISTPYGVASTSAIANFTGNQRKTRYNPIESSGHVSDFQSGLNLTLQGAGVRLPNGVLP